MKLAGEQRIALPRQQVWEGLNDPEVLQQCIPGCQSLEKESEDRLKATVQIKVGPIGAKFAGAVTLSDLDPPNAYTITGCPRLALRNRLIQCTILPRSDCPSNGSDVLTFVIPWACINISAPKLFTPPYPRVTEQGRSEDR